MIGDPLMTTRLTLEPVSASNQLDLFTVLQDPTIFTHLKCEQPATVNDVGINPGWNTAADASVGWVIFDSGRGAIGSIQAIRENGGAELTCVVHSTARGTGVGPEAMDAVVSQLRSHGVGPIIARVDEGNNSGHKLVAKLGFQIPFSPDVAKLLVAETGFCEYHLP